MKISKRSVCDQHGRLPRGSADHPAAAGGGRPQQRGQKLADQRTLPTEKALQTSGTPGKTRLINVFLINDSFHLVDLPGYGFAKVNKAEKKRWGEMMEAYFRESTLAKACAAAG